MVEESKKKGFAFIFLTATCLIFITRLIIYISNILTKTSNYYTIKYVNDTRCLDGSNAAYYSRKTKSLYGIIHLQGGGWCTSHESCHLRRTTNLGSSKNYKAIEYNPDPYGAYKLMDHFSEYNSFVVPYCDGGSWTGMKTHMLYDGRNTLEKTINDILKTNPHIKKILLTGCSAGGLGVIHSCHWIRSMFNVSLKCMHDGSLFFSDNNKIIRFHGGIEEDTIQLLTNVSGLFFTVTDWWDWDFITTEECKKSVEKCTQIEISIRNSRRRIVERVNRTQRVWITSKSYHCQLGWFLQEQLANEIHDFITS